MQQQSTTRRQKIHRSTARRLGRGSARDGCGPLTNLRGSNGYANSSADAEHQPRSVCTATRRLSHFFSWFTRLLPGAFKQTEAQNFVSQTPPQIDDGTDLDTILKNFRHNDFESGAKLMAKSSKAKAKQNKSNPTAVQVGAKISKPTAKQQSTEHSNSEVQRAGGCSTSSQQLMTAQRIDSSTQFEARSLPKGEIGHATGQVGAKTTINKSTVGANQSALELLYNCELSSGTTDSPRSLPLPWEDFRQSHGSEGMRGGNCARPLGYVGPWTCSARRLADCRPRVAQSRL